MRILVPGGTIILHVKNSSSVYWLTLRLAKRAKAFLGLTTQLEYVRPFRWYVRELTSLNYHVVDYNSFNWLAVEGMPKQVLAILQRLELKYRKAWLFRSRFIRRHGAELKIKAMVGN